jgi:hypothetical protein
MSHPLRGFSDTASLPSGGSSPRLPPVYSLLAELGRQPPFPDTSVSTSCAETLGSKFCSFFLRFLFEANGLESTGSFQEV